MGRTHVGVGDGVRHRCGALETADAAILRDRVTDVPSQNPACPRGRWAISANHCHSSWTKGHYSLLRDAYGGDGPGNRDPG